MKRFFFSWMAFLSFSLSACTANTTPTTRVHAAAGIPRFVDVDDFVFRERPEDRTRIGANAGIGYGPSWSDVGNLYGANTVHAGIHYRAPTFSVGWTPFFESAQVSHEGTGAFGSLGWISVPFGGGGRWRYSAQASIAGVSKVAEDRGCAKANISLFYTSCAGQPQSVSRAEISLGDLGLTLTIEKRASGNDSFLLAPSLHSTSVKSTNHLDVDSGNDVQRTTVIMSPGLQLGYVARSGTNLTTIFLLGAERSKSFRPDRTVRQWVLNGNLRLQF